MNILSRSFYELRTNVYLVTFIFITIEWTADIRIMQNKIYFLFVVFLLFVIRSTSIDLYSRKGKNDFHWKYFKCLKIIFFKGGSVLDYKNYGGGDDDDDSNTYKPASLNDDYSQASTYRRNRYSPYGSSSNNYRSRSRWPSSPSSYDERVDSNDWSPYGYGFK
jgi:hypothetical protein